MNLNSKGEPSPTRFQGSWNLCHVWKAFMITAHVIMHENDDHSYAHPSHVFIVTCMFCYFMTGVIYRQLWRPDDTFIWNVGHMDLLACINSGNSVPWRGDMGLTMASWETPVVVCPILPRQQCNCGLDSLTGSPIFNFYSQQTTCQDRLENLHVIITRNGEKISSQLTFSILFRRLHVTN